MPVQQHILNWLYSVLTGEYHDVNRTYNDVAQTLARYPTLSPRTDVHTFPNGASALLLHLSGTLPVNFRGSTYRFPMSIWVPHAYPRAAPLIYVTPTDTMMVRPGQHVDPQGQVYHPYLVGWTEFWDKSTIRDFLTILSDVFAKEPPVVSRQQARQNQPPTQHVQSPPPVPPLPPGVAPRPDSHGQPRAPPPPPRPGQESLPTPPSAGSATGPPLPPLPSQSPSSRRSSRYDSAPPLPSQGQQSSMPRPSQYQSPPSHRLSYASPPPPGPMPLPQHLPGGLPPSAVPVQGQWHPSGQPAPPPWGHTGPTGLQSHQQPRPQPPPDLLDEPLTLNIPDRAIAAPPIPPNPEKDALLTQLAQTLASIRHHSRRQNESSMAGLQAQRTAMLSVLPALQAEMGQLTQLSSVLNSNASILHDALRKADSVVEGSRSHPAPDIDELLVAPTVVSNQLYTLVAEERALGDAIFMLGRAVERGRISPTVFAKMTRSLAREWYLKKALVRKIGRGMGLS